MLYEKRISHIDMIMADIDIILFDPTQFYTSLNPYWIPVRAGVLLASQMQDINVKYHTPTCNGEYNLSQIHSDLSNIIKSVSARQPKGVIFSAPDFAYQAPFIQKHLLDQGIPVVSLDAVDNMPYEGLFGVGSSKKKEGQMALGKLMPENGDTIMICRHYKRGGSDLFDERDQGVDEYLAQNNLDKCQVVDAFLDVSPGVDHTQQLIQLLHKHEPQHILTYNVQTSTALIKAVKTLISQGRPPQVKIACVDLTLEVLKGIDEGVIMCAVDQQPFLMGFLSVTLFGVYLEHGIKPPNHIQTGPYLIDESNIKDTLVKFSQKR